MFPRPNRWNRMVFMGGMKNRKASLSRYQHGAIELGLKPTDLRQSSTRGRGVLVTHPTTSAC